MTSRPSTAAAILAVLAVALGWWGRMWAGIFEIGLCQVSARNASVCNGSALMLAFHSGREVAKKVNLLLDAGADPNLSGFPGSDPIVLLNCFAHGLELAPRIIEGSSEKLLRRFLAASETERFRADAAKDGVTWTEAFLALVRKRLKKLQRM